MVVCVNAVSQPVQRTIQLKGLGITLLNPHPDMVQMDEPAGRSAINNYFFFLLIRI